MIIYLDGKYLEEKDANVSVDDRAYVFGDGVYEGLRIYNNKIFKLDEHKRRFQRSINEIKINHTLSNEIEEIFQNLVLKNNYGEEELFYYIQVSRGKAKRNHSFPSVDTKIGMYAFIRNSPFNFKNYNNGVKVCTTPDIRWKRCDIKAISLLSNCMANQEALDNNCSESLFVNDNYITEGSRTNVFFIKENVIYTHPINNKILEGVTRNVVIELCKENKIELKEEALHIDDFNLLDEAFLTGTSGEVTPIISIDSFTLNNSMIGDITKKIQMLFKEEINIYTN